MERTKRKQITAKKVPAGSASLRRGTPAGKPERQRRPESRERARQGSVAPIDFAPRVIVKFAEGIDLDPTSHRVLLKRLGLADVRAFEKDFRGARIESLLNRAKRADLERLRELAVQRDATYRPRRLGNYTAVRVPVGVPVKEALDAVRGWNGVERAFVEAPIAPLPGVGEQRYLRPDNRGVGLYSSTSLESSVALGPGGSADNLGQGIKLVDIENDWDTNHAYLAPLTATEGTLSGVPADALHGRRVLGLILSSGGVDYRGIAPATTAFGVSPLNGTDYSVASAIYGALTSSTIGLSYGDVMLLEVQAVYHLDPTKNVPIEIRADVFDAIRLATALGVIVVEPSGTNPLGGNLNLDGVTDDEGQFVFDRTVRDSGAIVVGATEGATTDVLGTGNYGGRVDLCAPGNGALKVLYDGAATSAHGPLNGDGGIEGTSWAAASIAGAVSAVQSLVEDATPGYRLGPGPMRQLLSEQGGVVVANLGRIPDIVDALVDLGLVADVYMRDTLTDVGAPGTAGTVSQSPDIIPRQSESLDPATAFASPSDTTFHQQIEFGQDNFIYCRLWNRGGQPANNARVKLYWTKSSALPTPDQWVFLGEQAVTSTNIPASTGSPDPWRITPGIKWPANELPPVSHYCFVAIAASDSDPGPHGGPCAAPLPVLMNSATFVKLVRENNNIVWRNFNVVDTDPANFVSAPGDIAPPPGAIPLDVDVGGFPEEDGVFDVEVFAKLPPDAKLVAEAPAGLVRALFRGTPPFAVKNTKRKSLEFSVRRGRTTFKGVPLNAGFRERLRLNAYIPEKYRKGEYEVYVRQLQNGVELGRFTFHLVPTGRKPPGKKGVEKKPVARGRRAAR